MESIYLLFAQGIILQKTARINWYPILIFVFIPWLIREIRKVIKEKKERTFGQINLNKIWFDSKEKVISLDIGYLNSSKLNISDKIELQTVIFDEKGFRLGSVIKSLPSPIKPDEKHRIIAEVKVGINDLHQFKYQISLMRRNFIKRVKILQEISGVNP
ncbi:MAG: hypothetical protein NTW14_04115 [bacterium]|nr:hypothetical protein [bacterium]